MLVAEKRVVSLSWVSRRDNVRLMVTRVFLSALTRIPMSLEERLGVGFVENGKLRIVHWRIAMSVRGYNFLHSLEYLTACVVERDASK
jgi:hypothetical protein